MRRLKPACRGVSTPWLRAFRAHGVKALVLIPSVRHAAHMGRLACFSMKVVGLEPDAVWCIALRDWLRQAWRKSGSRAGLRLRGARHALRPLVGQLVAPV